MNPSNFTESEKIKELIECVNRGDIVGVRRLLAEGVKVDCEDESGMTPLQHAAYKGDLDICDLLVKSGANVNINNHKHGYTALMFAALSGSKEVVRFLLEHGASTTVENSVHRTASQMAGFVGRHEIVTLINNFFSREEIDYYCTSNEPGKEPKLPHHLSTPVYKLCTTTNLNPVKLTFILQDLKEILCSSKKVINVLDLLCEKMMKKKETDEVLALKFHYLSTFLKEASKFNEKESDNLESLVKYLMKARLSDGFPVNQEVLVRETFRTFPYPECQLLQHLVRSISSREIKEKLSAISVLQSAINGQRFASDEDKQCSTCGEYNGKTCNLCHSVYYCDKRCQKLHWFVHKNFCKNLALEYNKRKSAEMIKDTKNGEDGVINEDEGKGSHNSGDVQISNVTDNFNNINVTSTNDDNHTTT